MGRTKGARASRQVSKQVSESSNWKDPIWKFAHTTPGQRDSHAQINWQAIENRKGQNLFDSGPNGLLEEFRVFVDSWINEPQVGPSLGPGSMPSVAISLTELFSWMTDESFESVSEINEEASWAFSDWLAANYEVVADEAAAVGRPRQLTHSSAIRIVNVLIKLYEQRTPMKRAGVGALTERPFGEDSTALAVVTREMGLPREGKLQPIPDEIALPVLSEAFRMIGVPADDVLRLQGQALADLEGLAYYENADDLTGYASAMTAHNETIMNFQFTAPSPTGAPWRGQIEPSIRRTLIDGREVELSAVQQLRRLIITVVEACVVILQGLTGMRAHELISLEAGELAPDGSPECLRTRRTADGAYEVFLVEGITAKGVRRDARWVIGARPLGTRHEPPTVRALRVLGLLLEPWRKLGKLTTLLVSFSSARGLPKSPDSIGRVLSGALTYWQREFAFENVDATLIPEHLRGVDGAHWHIRGHRWRPTFAIHLFRIHPKLVPAISSHLQHTSEVMTQHGYIGNNPAFLDAFNAARVQFTARVLLHMSSGKTPAAGSAARLVERFRDELRNQIGLGAEADSQARAEAFVTLHGLEVWNAPHGGCLMVLMPSESRCRQMSGTASWQNTTPDLKIRTPQVCAGCKCLYVWKDHEPYWRKVKAEHEEVLAAARTDEQRAELRVSAARFSVASAFVAKLSEVRPEA